MTTKPPISVRITDQYRDRDIMVYELNCEGTRLAVRFYTEENDGTPLFRAEVQTNERENALTVNGTGKTRLEALNSAGTAWAAALGSRPYRAFEWSGIEGALAQVRAL